MRTLKENIRVQSSPQAVWDVLADFGDTAAWAPGMRRSEVKGEPKTGVGSYRVMRHVWGFTIEESVTQWTEGAGYAFDLVRAPFPMCKVHETVRLEQGDGHAVVTTSVSYAMRLGVIGYLLDAVFVRFLIRREMRTSLRGLKHFVELKAANGVSPVLATPVD